MNNSADTKKGVYLMLHISLLFSSLSGVCSKMSSRYTGNIFSLPFIFWFGLVFVIMFGYALIWQQILRRMPLTVAYANKPVTLIWGILWGYLIFDEKVTWNMIAGALIIFAGIYLVSSDNEEDTRKKTGGEHHE